MCLGSISVVLGFVWLLIIHISMCETMKKEYYNSLLDYTISIFLATAVFDIFVAVAKFTFFPVGLSILGNDVYITGHYYFEKVKKY